MHTLASPPPGQEALLGATQGPGGGVHAQDLQGLPCSTDLGLRVPERQWVLSCKMSLEKYGTETSAYEETSSWELGPQTPLFQMVLHCLSCRCGSPLPVWTAPPGEAMQACWGQL